MSSHQKAVWIGLGVALAASVPFGALSAFLAQQGADWPLALQLAVLAAVMALAYPISLPWWRRLDEMARQAHLVSWFWGAQIGGGLAIMAAAALVSRGWVPDELVHGALLVLIVQLAASFVLWAGWWLRRRGGEA